LGQEHLLAVLQLAALLVGTAGVFQRQLHLDELAARVALLGQQVGVGRAGGAVVWVVEDSLFQGGAQAAAHGWLLPGPGRLRDVIPARHRAQATQARNRPLPRCAAALQSGQLKATPSFRPHMATTTPGSVWSRTNET